MASMCRAESFGTWIWSSSSLTARVRIASGYAVRVLHRTPCGRRACMKACSACADSCASSASSSLHMRNAVSHSEGFSALRSGMTDCRRRFLRASGRRLVLSVTQESLFWARYASISSRETASIGRINGPRFGGMPQSPASPVPRVRFRSTVSRLSSCVWAVAIRPGREEKNA